MKPIIAATDFSPVSINAVNFAADMAVALNTELILFNVFNIPVSYGEVPVALVSVEELKDASNKELLKLKEGLDRVVSGKIKISTESSMGNIVDEIEEYCKKTAPLAVVMGTKGKSNLESILFGSTALGAIRHLTIPVVCVPQGQEYGEGIKRVGFACDFKQIVEKTPVKQIKEIVQAFNAKLHVINIDHQDQEFSPETLKESEHLHKILQELNPEYHFIDNPDVEEGINEFAETNNLDLIIAIPKKHKLLDKLFHTSATKNLVYHSHIPVMCVHED